LPEFGSQQKVERIRINSNSTTKIEEEDTHSLFISLKIEEKGLLRHILDGNAPSWQRKKRIFHDTVFFLTHINHHSDGDDNPSSLPFPFVKT